MENIENRINKILKSLHPESRPIMTNGFRAQSVAKTTKGYFEVTTNHGHCVMVETETMINTLKSVESD